jgi:hypothetical protein
VTAIHRTGALDYSRQQAVAQAEQARDQVALITSAGQASSDYRDALLYFAAYSIDRDR